MTNKAKPVKRGIAHQEQLAFRDTSFLLREEMRATRLALEFERADLGLKDQGIKSTVVVFGSARSIPRQTAGALSKSAKRGKSKPPTGSRLADLAHWYREARIFARIVSERGGALSPRDGLKKNVIATGGGPGIMEAANRGAADAGAPSIGFNIKLPEEQKPNKYVTPELSFQFNYFAIRKMHFAMRANALAVFPGGFGTLDELFEILTLKQTRKAVGMPVILFCRHYWENVVNLQGLAELGTIDRNDLDLFTMVDNAEEGWEAMVGHGLTTPTPLQET